MNPNSRFKKGPHVCEPFECGGAKSRNRGIFKSLIQNPMHTKKPRLATGLFLMWRSALGMVDLIQIPFTESNAYEKAQHFCWAFSKCGGEIGI